MPFAKRRINKLPEILKNDWLPRKKYVYVGLNSNFPLTDFVREKILTSYTDHIVWDEWDESQYEWQASEPDNINRVTIFWQDIGEDFDGDPMIIVATYSPNNFEISRSNNFHQFTLSSDNQSISYNGKEISTTDAEKKIQEIIDQALSSFA
jgi:hypothetical protein